MVYIKKKGLSLKAAICQHFLRQQNMLQTERYSSQLDELKRVVSFEHNGSSLVFFGFLEFGICGLI